MVGQAHHRPLAQYARDRALHRLARLLVDDPEDFVQRSSARIGARPSGQGFGHRIDDLDSALRVSGDHTVAHAHEGDAVAFLALTPRSLGLKQGPVVGLLIPLPDHDADHTRQDHETQEERENDPRPDVPSGERLGRIYFGYHEPGRVWNRLQDRHHPGTPVVQALDDPYLALNGHDSRHVRLAQRNAQLQRRICPMAQLVQK